MKAFRSFLAPEKVQLLKPTLYQDISATKSSGSTLTHMSAGGLWTSSWVCTVWVRNSTHLSALWLTSFWGPSNIYLMCHLKLQRSLLLCPPPLDWDEGVFLRSPPWRGNSVSICTIDRHYGRCGNLIPFECAGAQGNLNAICSNRPSLRHV